MKLLIKVLCLSGRCGKAWENELQLSSLWPRFCLSIFGTGSNADLCKGNCWALVGSCSAFTQCTSLSGSVPYSQLDNLPVLLVSEITSQLIFLLFAFRQRRNCRAGYHNGQAQVSLFIWRPLKAHKRKGTD